ncbi:MAG: hypothetical protein ACRCY8_17510 [Dermatophilaceae bacterium]
MRRPLALRPRASAVVAAVLLAGVSALAGAPSATAAACSGSSGVTVVVDTGSGVVTRCATGDPSSGLAALTAAGFSVSQVRGQPGFVCTIDGFPSSQTCARTPPATAYWSYWHAPRGGSWSYSQLGAGTYDPKPGTVEGWRFGSGQQPRTAPPAATTISTPKPATPTPPAATSRPPTTAPSTSGPNSGRPPTVGSDAAPSASATTSAPPPPRTAGPTTPPTPTSSTTTSATPPGTPGGTPTASGTSSDEVRTIAGRTTSADAGPGVGTAVAGGALAALVAAGAGYTAWRRRG